MAVHDNIKLRGAYIATPMTGGRRRIVLKDVDLTVSEGELIYLIGRVGSGKSSLLKTLYGEIPLSRGKGLVAGFRLDGLVRSDIPMLRRKLGMVFQDFQLLHDRTVYQNLGFVLRATGWKDPEHIRHRIEETLDTIGLLRKAGSMPHQLSGGEQQRVAVGRAFLNRPAVILADEPTGNLDPESAAEVMELFLKLAGKGCSVLLATHNISLIEQYPARIIRIKEGTLEEVDHAAVFGSQQSAMTPFGMPQTAQAVTYSSLAWQPSFAEDPSERLADSRFIAPVAHHAPEYTASASENSRFAAPIPTHPILSSEKSFASHTYTPDIDLADDGGYAATPLFPDAAGSFFTPVSESAEEYAENGNDLWENGGDTEENYM